MSSKKNIARINDLCRSTLSGCRVLLTRALAADPNLDQVLEAVRDFDDFTPENDPHKEHDFGAVVVDNNKYFWKFDYYDDAFQYYMEDGNRVLTIMLASEY